MQTMGDLATEYGYYGAEWAVDMDTILAEAGEVRTGVLCWLSLCVLEVEGGQKPQGARGC